MKTRKDHLVQLVAGLDSWPEIGKVTRAVALLAEIEKACPETEFRPPVVMQTENVRIYMQKDVDALVAAERERCAKIADYALQLFNTTEGRACALHIREEIRGAK